MPDEVVVVDSENPVTRERATQLVEGLLSYTEPGAAISILILATEAVLGMVLHGNVGEPEKNIQAVRTILDTMRYNVLLHEDCARGVPAQKTSTVH